MLGNYGSRVKYINEAIGYNSRLDPMQAAILRAKLPLLNEWNTRRNSIAERYNDAFGSLLPTPAMPSENCGHAWHLYVVRHHDRDRLQQQLAELGVATLIHYPHPPHRQAAYAAMGLGPGSLPLAEQYAASVLSLPIGPHLTSEQVDRVIEAVRCALAMPQKI